MNHFKRYYIVDILCTIFVLCCGVYFLTQTKQINNPFYVKSTHFKNFDFNISKDMEYFIRETTNNETEFNKTVTYGNFYFKQPKYENDTTFVFFTSRYGCSVIPNCTLKVSKFDYFGKENLVSFKVFAGYQQIPTDNTTQHFYLEFCYNATKFYIFEIKNIENGKWIPMNFTYYTENWNDPKELYIEWIFSQYYKNLVIKDITFTAISYHNIPIYIVCGFALFSLIFSLLVVISYGTNKLVYLFLDTIIYVVICFVLFQSITDEKMKLIASIYSFLIVGKFKSSLLWNVTKLMIKHNLIISLWFFISEGILALLFVCLGSVIIRFSNNYLYLGTILICASLDSVVDYEYYYNFFRMNIPNLKKKYIYSFGCIFCLFCLVFFLIFTIFAAKYKSIIEYRILCPFTISLFVDVIVYGLKCLLYSFENLNADRIGLIQQFEEEDGEQNNNKHKTKEYVKKGYLWILLILIIIAINLSFFVFKWDFETLCLFYVLSSKQYFRQ